ncbi:MAG: ABC transporter permease [Erysipelotrichia bacterium]|jgi:D-methionine transport system permease protein|nr:ABC transporter permease [Erysipelotrichia bacterium]
MNTLLIQATLDTLRMIGFGTLFAFVLGFPLGILLYLTQDQGLLKHKPLYHTLSTLINTLRSVPFMILIIALFPLTRLIVGRSYGVNASIVALVIGAFPFVARLIETSFNGVDPQLIKATQTMGANPLQIILKVVLVEAMPSLIHNIALTMITLVGYSAMAGAVGGGGLGDVAIRYGLHRYQTDVMLMTIVILVVLVQLIQWAFNALSHAMDHR